ncbi:MAG: hypothetical protein J6Y36_03765 [Treponema sp.]|nr:hypothetical protein [Treponema sp.]
MFAEFEYKPVLEDYNKDGTLKIGAILKVLENSGNTHSDKAGDRILDGANNKKSWVLTDWKISINKYPVYGDKITAKTWSQTVTQILNVSRDFELYCNGEICAIGTTRWIILDLDTGRPCKIEQDLISKYGPESKSVYTETKLEKIPVPEDFSAVKEIQIRRSDIDFNDHVHNLTYLDYAMEVLPEDIYEKQNFSTLRITYKSVVKSGEKLVAKYKSVDGANIVFIYNDKDELKTQILLK